MVTEITLGTFGTQGGKTVLTGGASKIDTKGLIDSLAAAKRTPAVRLETKNTAIDGQTAALNDLKTIFAKFQAAVDTLRNPPGVDVDSKNIFQYRTASVTTSTGATASNFLDVTVQPGAVAQSYTINSITQLAFQTKQQSGNFLLADSSTASAVTANGVPTAGLFEAGTINLRAVDGTVGGIPLTLSEGDSLETVASKFNEISSRTGIQASVLTVATGTYKLIFTATKPGTTFGFDLSQTAPVAGAGIESDPAGVFSQLAAITTTQTAQNSLFTIDGVAISRESNSVSDALDGVTFTLKQPTSSGTIGVSIVPDTALVSSAITQFADAYNEFKLFAANQSLLDENSQPKETSVLYNNATFRNIVAAVSSEVSRVVAGITGSGNPSQLSDIGLKLENFAGDDTNPETKNILTLDTDALQSALLSNFDGVRKLFEYQQVSDNSSFLTSKRSNNLNISSFQVVIDSVGGTYQATYTDPTSGLITVDFVATAIAGGGVSLKGPVGSALEGSEFVFAAAGSATINVSLTQGFGDRFYNLIDGFTNAVNGTVTTELSTLNDAKTRNTTEITTIDERISRLRDQLVQQFANLEAALSKANNLLQLLDAQANARNNA
ncbi:MAG: flagellar filament capping protein FliD [Alphaproteobacteria bacterium]|nr:flagellar filament capping protein FliD [Alphaproteobacteria bacterium]